MLFPRKPRGLGSSKADSYRWDGHVSQSHCNPAPSCPRVLILAVEYSLLLGLWREELTRYTLLATAR